MIDPNTLPAVEFNKSADGSWSIRATDPDGLRQKLGEDLFGSIACCFAQADRINSLVYLMSLSRTTDPEDSVASRRNFTTFYFFLVGTLKELSLELGRLRGILCRRSIWDKAAWGGGLKKFEEWGNKHDNSELRNQLSFHVSSEELRRGARLLSAGDAEILIEGDGPKRKNSWCRVATLALFRALEEKVQDFDATVADPADLMDVSTPLEQELLRILKILGLMPTATP